MDLGKGLGELTYSTLVHPGDSYSYDIFSQIGTAIRAKSDEILAGLKKPKATPSNTLRPNPARQRPSLNGRRCGRLSRMIRRRAGQWICSALPR